MKLGTQDVTALKVGAVNASKAYLGSTLVWEAGGPGPGPGLPSDPDGIWLESLFIDGLSDGANLTAWEDASTAGYDLALRSGDTAPKLRTGVTPTGAPVVRAPSADSRLEGESRWRSVISEPLTLFAVAATTAASFTEMVSNSNDSVGPYLLFPGALNALRWRRSSGTSGGQINFGTGTNDGNFHVFTVCFDPANTRIRAYVGKALDGEATGVAQVSAPDIPLRLFGMYASSSRSWLGDFAALLWYRSALSDSDREAVIDYLTERYISPP